MNKNNRPKIGIAVIVKKDNKVLLGKRKNAHGEGSWAFPGGHLEYQESFEKCATREVLEETGLQITNIRQVTLTNDIFEQENKHYITVFLLVDWKAGKPQTLEPDKCEGWQWFNWNDIPDQVFLPIKNLKKLGYDPLL